MANYRRGPSRGSKPSQRRGTQPWRRDPEILRRLDMLMQMLAEGYYPHQAHQTLNAWLIDHGKPPISTPTFSRDCSRARELYQERVADSMDGIVASLTLVKREAWRGFNDSKGNLRDRSPYLREVRMVDEALAKMSGLMDNKTRVTVSGDPENPVEHTHTLMLTPEQAAEALRYTLEFVPDFRQRVLGPAREENGHVTIDIDPNSAMVDDLTDAL